MKTSEDFSLFRGLFIYFQLLFLCSIFISPGWTGEKVCLAGDSAGGNLCVTTSMRAAAYGVRMPDGIVAAYPATLLTAYASPSRLLTLMDPLLPLSVLSRCLSAYAGVCVSVCLPVRMKNTCPVLPAAKTQWHHKYFISSACALVICLNQCSGGHRETTVSTKVFFYSFCYRPVS